MGWMKAHLPRIFPSHAFCTWWMYADRQLFNFQMFFSSSRNYTPMLHVSSIIQNVPGATANASFVSLRWHPLASRLFTCLTCQLCAVCFKVYLDFNAVEECNCSLHNTSATTQARNLERLSIWYIGRMTPLERIPLWMTESRDIEWH